jgi:hypothetical protein
VLGRSLRLLKEGSRFTLPALPTEKLLLLNGQPPPWQITLTTPLAGIPDTDSTSARVEATVNSQVNATGASCTVRRLKHSVAAPSPERVLPE